MKTEYKAIFYGPFGFYGTMQRREETIVGATSKAHAEKLGVQIAVVNDWRFIGLA